MAARAGDRTARARRDCDLSTSNRGAEQARDEGAPRALRRRGEQYETDATPAGDLACRQPIGAARSDAGVYDNNPERAVAVFLLGRLVHGDRAGGREHSHLISRFGPATTSGGASKRA